MNDFYRPIECVGFMALVIKPKTLKINLIHPKYFVYEYGIQRQEA